MIRHVWHGRVSTGSERPRPKGAGRPPNLWAQPTPKLFDLQRRNLVRKHTRESRVFQGSRTLYRKGSRLQRLQVFLEPLSTTKRFDLQRRNLVGNICGEYRVYSGQSRPCSNWRGPCSFLQIFGASYMRAHSMRNNDQIVYGDQTRCEANV